MFSELIQTEASETQEWWENKPEKREKDREAHQDTVLFLNNRPM